jgi:hypothetical protein
LQQTADIINTNPQQEIPTGGNARSSHRSGLDQMRTDQFFQMWLP